ncbi:glial cell line-derived neurotrophic factor-like [Acipenser oxyrinchus oxyrinchus]|uniref:Glial cell line-derived neurotrophic factor n=1 Tax=Acipenser oxyrinchus oxyrinchus TaxID=40147 RepID=A0AAD8LV09_ACIOX|nr:glial cell line-derived neurotrophic factor-like [Acipenser oxyrinchus oxyrinchus]
MKLWDVLATCLLLLTAVATSPLFGNWYSGRTKSTYLEQQQEVPSLLLEDSEPQSDSVESTLEEYTMPELYPEQFEDVVEFIQATIKRLKRSPDWALPARNKGDKRRQKAPANTDTAVKKPVRNRNRGCVLKEIHLNVTDLDLGYQTKEELIFRYCSGSCNSRETTYDMILQNLTKNKKLAKEKLKMQACCRPTAFDDDVSFLDDNLIDYRTLKKHSAKKCGCI